MPNLEELISKREPSSQDILDMNDIAQAIIEAEGDLALVAERLLGNKNSQDQVLSLISADAASLEGFASKTRAYALIKTMSLFSALGYHVMMQLPELKPEDSVKAFIKISEVMERLTQKQSTMNNTNNINVFETIMGQVPAPVAEAIKELIRVPQQQLTPPTNITPQANAPAINGSNSHNLNMD